MNGYLETTSVSQPPAQGTGPAAMLEAEAKLVAMAVKATVAVATTKAKEFLACAGQQRRMRAQASSNRGRL